MPPVERRTFLVLGASLIGVSACTGDAVEVDPSPTVPRPPARDPDGPLRERVAAAERALIARYRTAITDSPGLAGTLAPFLAHHEAHLARVAPGTGAPEPSASGAAPSGSLAPSASAPPSPSASASASASTDSPAARDVLLRDLAEAERDAFRDRLSACDGAASGVLARDLCLIAASEAQHAAVLDAASAGPRP